MEPTDRTVRMLCCVGLMLPLAWATFDLQCNVTQTPDGRFELRLSEPPPSPDCSWLWEDENKMNLAVRSYNFSSQVFKVSEQYLILKICSNYIRYERDCLTQGWTQAVCSFNCSSVVTPTPPHPGVALVPEPWLWLTVAAGILTVVAVGSGIYGCIRKSLARRRHQDQAETVEREMEEMKVEQDQQPEEMSTEKVPLAEVQY